MQLFVVFTVVLKVSRCKAKDALASDISSSCDVKSLQLAPEGEGFNSIVQPGRSALTSRVLEEGDVTEEDQDDEDGIRFVTLESWFENKETVLNW